MENVLDLSSRARNDHLDLADLDRAVIEVRALAGDLDRAIVVLGLDLEEAADDLFTFSVRAVDDRRLTACPSHHAPRAVLKLLAADDHPAFLQTHSPVAIFLNDRLHFRRARFVESVG